MGNYLRNNFASRKLSKTSLLIVSTSAALIAGCGGNETPIPQLGEAKSATLKGACADLATNFTFANTTVLSATPVAAGTLTVGGNSVAAHCQVKGEMHRRTSAVDAKSYAIGFEMRMPNDWNGRFFYQANGGLDGSVGTAVGQISGLGTTVANTSNALHQGLVIPPSKRTIHK